MKTTENKIIINNQYFDYVIERKKIKNIYFRVKEDLKIHISCNSFVSETYIKKLLLENSNSIIKMFNNMNSRENKGLSYLGNPLTYIYQDSKPYLENNTIYGKSEEECHKYIYNKALDIFSNRLTRIKEQFPDLPDFTLKVRKMTSKWGVCNKGNMSITLNTELITKDVHLIDYVIIHELCHFKYMNHSKDYWNYVSKFYPYYKEARKELKY